LNLLKARENHRKEIKDISVKLKTILLIVLFIIIIFCNNGALKFGLIAVLLESCSYPTNVLGQGYVLNILE
jgi:hypothetical protein